MSTLKKITGNYIEMVRALGLLPSFYGRQLSTTAYEDQINLDLHRTNFISYSSNVESVKESLSSTKHLAGSLPSYTQGNNDGGIFANFLVSISLNNNILAEAADEEETKDEHYADSIRVAYVDDSGKNCALAISYRRGDPTIDKRNSPAENRKRPFAVTVIRNTTLVPTEREVTCFINPVFLSKTPIDQAIDINSVDLPNELATVTNSKNLNELLTGIFNDDSISLEHFDSLNARLGNNRNIDNRDLKKEQLLELVTFVYNKLNGYPGLKSNYGELESYFNALVERQNETDLFKDSNYQLLYDELVRHASSIINLTENPELIDELNLLKQAHQYDLSENKERAEALRTLLNNKGPQKERLQKLIDFANKKLPDNNELRYQLNRTPGTQDVDFYLGMEKITEYYNLILDAINLLENAENAAQLNKECKAIYDEIVEEIAPTTGYSLEGRDPKEIKQHKNLADLIALTKNLNKDASFHETILAIEEEPKNRNFYNSDSYSHAVNLLTTRLEDLAPNNLILSTSKLIKKALDPATNPFLKTELWNQVMRLEELNSTNPNEAKNIPFDELLGEAQRKAQESIDCLNIYIEKLEEIIQGSILYVNDDNRFFYEAVITSLNRLKAERENPSEETVKITKAPLSNFIYSIYSPEKSRHEPIFPPANHQRQLKQRLDQEETAQQERINSIAQPIRPEGFFRRNRNALIGAAFLGLIVIGAALTASGIFAPLGLPLLLGTIIGAAVGGSAILASIIPAFSLIRNEIKHPKQMADFEREQRLVTTQIERETATLTQLKDNRAARKQALYERDLERALETNAKIELDCAPLLDSLRNQAYRVEDELDPEFMLGRKREFNPEAASSSSSNTIQTTVIDDSNASSSGDDEARNAIFDITAKSPQADRAALSIKALSKLPSKLPSKPASQTDEKKNLEQSEQNTTRMVK